MKVFLLIILTALITSCSTYDPWEMNGVAVNKNIIENIEVIQGDKVVEGKQSLIDILRELVAKSKKVERVKPKIGLSFLDIKNFKNTRSKTKTKQVAFKPFYVGDELISNKVIINKKFNNWEEVSNYYYKNQYHAKRLRFLNGSRPGSQGSWIFLPRKGLITSRLRFIEKLALLQ